MTDHGQEPPLPLLETRPGSATTAYANAGDWWQSVAETALGWLAELGQPFEAYDVILLGCPEPDHPNRLGGLLRSACRRGLIEAVGYKPSGRPTVNGSIVRVWRGVRT